MGIGFDSNLLPPSCKSELVAWPYQAIGILCVLFIAILFLVGLVTPDFYDCFIPPKEVDETTEAEGKQVEDCSDENEALAEEGKLDGAFSKSDRVAQLLERTNKRRVSNTEWTCK